MADYLFDQGKNKIVGLSKEATERKIDGLIDDSVESLEKTYSSDKISSIVGNVENDADQSLKSLTGITFDEPLNFANDNKYLHSASGNLGSASSHATTDFIKVFKGQKLYLHCYANGTNEAAVCLYNTQKTYIGEFSKSTGESIITVTQDGYARFSTRKNQISINDAYVRNLSEYNALSDLSENRLKTIYSDEIVKAYFSNGNDVSVSNGEKTYFPSLNGKHYHYDGNVSPTRRFMSIGFDDFRDSDFSAIMPIFEKHEALTTFNKILTNEELTKAEVKKINNVVFGNHEIGDHTILHAGFAYIDALFNGQNPNSPDGSQIAFPTNAMMRNDAGDGKNVFGIALTNTIVLEGYTSSTKWGELSDEECQTIREKYSVFKNSSLITLLDTLSNKYLGTSGTSNGSWNDVSQKYTGGVFTDCKTSENHEIWERICEITRIYYKEQYGLNWNIWCWSFPGGNYFGKGFAYNSKYYYDSEHIKLFNMEAKFASSLYKDEIGNAKSRSFIDVLREYNYKYSHDMIFDGRLDGDSVCAMRRQFFYNENLSRKDSLSYPTNRTISYNNISTAYPSSFFTTGKTKAAQMYDGGGEFYNFIEAVRHDTANGIIHGEAVDSVDNYSERTFFDEALKFCKNVGIEVITKQDAYDICYNHPILNGNLIYNPFLINSAEEYLKDAVNIPTNPDGYKGSCYVSNIDGVNVLVTSGETTYLHFGIPYGKIKYNADIKGNGSLVVYLIKNADNYNLNSLTQLVSLSFNNEDFESETFTEVIPDNPITVWSQKCEGYDNKIIGLKFVYSSGLQIKNIRLELA